MNQKSGERSLLYILIFSVFGLCIGRLLIVYGLHQTSNGILVTMYFCIYFTLLFGIILTQKTVLHLYKADGISLRAFLIIVYFTSVFVIRTMRTKFYLPFLNMTLSLMIFISAINIGKSIVASKLLFRICVFAYYILAIMFIYSRIHGFTYFDSPGMVEYYAQFQNSVYYVLLSLPFPLCSNKRYVKYSSLILAIICVLMSFKLTALLAITVGLFFYIGADSKVNKGKYSQKMLNRLCFALILCFVSVILVQIVGKRFGSTVIEKIQQSYLSGGSGRTQIYTQVMQEQMKSSIIDWVFGHGYDMVNDVVGISAHNDFMEILFDYGIIGFALYISLILSIVKKMKLLRKLKYRLYPPMVLSFVFFTILSMLSHLFLIRMYFQILMMFWGIIISVTDNEPMSIERKYGDVHL